VEGDTRVREVNDIYAFITGIEKYEQTNWSVGGPARAAVEMAKWVLTLEGNPAHIYLFVAIASEKHDDNVRSALLADLDDLKARGVKVEETATRSVLYEFWRNTLIKFGAGRLFAYWSGHGGVNGERDRIFYCEDYTTAKTANVFDWNTVLESLRSDETKGIGQQFALADVCGVYVSKSASPDKGLELKPRVAEQTAFYATPEGEYAEGQAFGGDFSRRALAVLAALKGWPDPLKFYDEIVEDNPKRPFVLDAQGKSFARPARVVGIQTAIPPTAARALELLQPKARAEDEYWPLYKRTIEPLRSAALWRVRMLASMLAELSKLGCDHGEALPRPFVEFLLRTGFAFNFVAAVRTWCKKEGCLDTTLRTIEEKLARERRRHHLLVELEEDTAGKLQSISPVLYNHDLSTRTGPQWGSIPIEGDDETLCRQLRTVIDEARAFVEGAPLQVQFLANPVLLGRALHAIELQKGRPLGGLVPAVVRWRERVLRPQDCAPELWKKHEESIRQKAAVALLPQFHKPIEQDALATAVRKKQMFVLLSPDPEVIAGALQLGAPFLCWTHIKEIKGVDVVGSVRAWTKGSATLDDIPDALHHDRQLLKKVACNVTLLWDNPRLLPDAEKRSPGRVKRLRLPGRG
jgi:hypothetical protein